MTNHFLHKNDRKIKFPVLKEIPVTARCLRCSIVSAECERVIASLELPCGTCARVDEEPRAPFCKHEEYWGTTYVG